MSSQKLSETENKPIEVLIVEDSRTQAEQLRYLLEQQGYKVDAALNGKEALEIVQTQKPDLIISDIIMPEMDGYGLCKAIKSVEKLKDIPVILVTTLSDPQDIIKGLECGADNFIRKPYNGTYLLSCINYLLMNAELRKNQKITMGMGVCLGGRTHFITAERQQILDLLISTFEQAVHINSELKLREMDLASSNEVLSGLYRLTEGLNQAVSEQEVVQIALERTMDVLEVDAGWIVLHENENDFRIAATCNLPAELQTQDAFEGDCSCRHSLASGKIESVRRFNCERLKHDNGGILDSHVSVPLIVGTRKLGLMNLISLKNISIADENLVMLNSIGYQIAVALERAKLHEHLEQLVNERTAKLAAEVVQRKRIQAEQARLIAIIEATPDLVGTMMPDGRLRYANQAGLRLLGRHQGDDLSDLFFEDRYPEWAGKKITEESIPYAIQHGVWTGETMIVNHEGVEVPLLQVILAHKDKDGTVQYLSTIGRDITQIKKHEARIVRLNRIHSVLSGINTTIVRVREKQELFDEACRIAVELGQFMFAWIGMLGEEMRHIEPVAKAGCDGELPEQINLSEKLDEKGICRLLTEAISQAKPIVCNDIALDPLIQSRAENAPSLGYRSVAVFPLLLENRPVGVFALYAPEINVFDKEEMDLLIEMAGDISFSLDHFKKEERLNYLAYFDAVTGLPNRSLFLDRLHQIIGIAHQAHENIAVIVMDVERFSNINESFGRQAGDELLRQISRQLETMLAETDILAHLSADYFGIAIRYKMKAADISRDAKTLLSGIHKHSFLVGQRDLRVLSRAGIAVYPSDAQDNETLLRNAEAALKKAKQTGDRHLFYVPEINACIFEKLTLENKLRRALDQAQFVLFYQPKIEFTTGRICGLEALIRWRDPENGLVPPNKFIPLLEETGMIIEVGHWALKKAISDSQAWQQKGLVSPSIAVNVSPLQLHQRDFVQTVENVLNDAGDISVELELEITESLIMQDIETNIRKLKMLRNMNVEIAIDDFGTGYSSLSYLTKLPVTTLKIDRAFIMNMTSNSDDMSVVSAIISLAHSLNMRVVAEGVENDEQRNMLRLLKCNEMQGYLFSPAIPAEQIESFLHENKSFSDSQTES
ncbi:MAG: EAL domain-containing protein [Gammaproteobacteria bacterium]